MRFEEIEGGIGKSRCVNSVCPACRWPWGGLVHSLADRTADHSTHWPLDWLTDRLPGRPGLDNTGGSTVGRSPGGT